MPRPRFIASVVASIVALTAGGTLTGCESKVSKDSFAQINNGMTMHEVEKILGESGTEDSSPPGFEVSGGGIATTKDAPTDKIYVWKGDGVTIVVTFQNGKVVAKALR
ncbi:MAG: hypothetical protein AB7G11_10840 [Phycisphaerales bacterium]